MELKKTILVFIFFTGIIGCECFNGGTEWNISSFEVDISDKLYNEPSNGIIEGDSVRLLTTFEAEFLSFYSNPLNGLMNSAYATTCEEPGDEGLNDKVKGLIITSNSDFNDIPAGESLNELITVNRQKIKDWIFRSENWSFRSRRMNEFIFLEQPEIGSNHIFTIQFTMESGKILEQDTEAVQWN